MTRKRDNVRKKSSYLLFFILIFNLISIVSLPVSDIKEIEYEKSNDSPESLIQTSSSGPPNKHFFQCYKTITIDHKQVSGTGGLKNFPVLISILDSDLHNDVQSTGNDIAFANNTAWLDHELELFQQDYSSTQAKLVAWVRVPSLSTSLDTIIYLYYGNASMSPRENPEGVWDNNHEGVWHLSESPSDPAPQFQDRTSNNNDGTAYGGMNSSDQVSGQIDGSIDFDGSDDYISLGSSINIASSSFSVSTWAKRGSSSTADIIFQQGPPGQNTGFHAGFRSSGLFTFAFWADDLDTTQSYNDTDWHHWACTYDAPTNARKIYRDGVNIASDTAFNHFLGSGTFYIGYDGMVSEGFDGQLDDSRLLNIALSSEWINTSYINQNDPESFYSIGKGKSLSNPPNAQYFTYYKEIRIDHSMVTGLSDLLNFPVLISILDTDLHDDVQSTGNDVAFANDTAWLDHEIELFKQDYNSTHAQLIVWVRVPRLSTSLDTIIRMYYGNSTMSSRENPSEVWNSNYKGVWHFKETSGGVNMIKDSTDNDNHGTDSGNPTLGQTGIIGNSIVFDGLDDQIDVGNDTSLKPMNEVTIELWLKKSSINPLEVIVGGDSEDSKGPQLFFNYNSHITFRFNKYNTKVASVDYTSYADGAWHYIVATKTLTSSGIYIDGLLMNITAYSSSSMLQSDDHLIIANEPGRTYNINGSIDEVEFSNIERNAAWISTKYNNQYKSNNFYSIGKEYTVSGNPPKEYFFKFHKEITISRSMVSGLHDLLNFPVLISILDTDLHDDVGQSNGNDIAFAYNGAWLDHEIESFDQTYNDTHAQLIAWVCIPRLLTSIDTVIRIYYGNLTMGPREDPEGVWDPNYKAIWHLSEDPTGTVYDSTSNDKDGTSSGSMDSNDQITGKINGALDFDGTDDTISFGSWTPSADFNPSSGTVSFWINRQFLDSASENKMVLQIRASGTNRIMFRFDGGGYEWRFHHEGNDIQTVMNPPAGEIPRLEWIYVVQTWDVNSDFHRGYINGSLFGSISGLAHPTTDSYDIYLASDKNGGEYFYGSIDEVRFSDTYRTDEWIETEYNNQNDPQSYLTLGPENSFDVTPPTFSNLIESSDPLELGNIEIITIDVFDPSGINQVKIEFGGTNHSMTNIGGDTWQYDSWTPSSVGDNSYTIWMEDNSNNWNSSVGTIEVIDTTPPTYSDLIESADPLQLGQNETITIKVYDSPGSGVNQVLLEYGSVNHTMTLISPNTWSWSKWKPAIGSHPYIIYMEDMENNWNYTSGTITVEESYAPIIENLTRSEDPLELGNFITIRVDVFDNETNVSTVFIELDSFNYTMIHVGGNTYEHNWTRSSVGLVRYVIYANDSLDNWNSYSGSFDIVDTTAPVIGNLSVSENPLELGDTVLITVNCTDLSNINLAKIEYLSSNHTMLNLTGEIWQYNIWTPETTGNLTYIIWVEDNNNNWASISDWILVQDTTPPIYSDLTESAKIIELGEQLTISINATDLADIKSVSIEYEISNHTMTNIGGDIWQYNSWVPTSIGNYTYTIYITDKNDNLNYVESSILFRDTKVPVYSNLFESADPLELGNNPIIRIDVYDIAGINQSLIEFEGANHSMINIYGSTWQYDSWAPNHWVTYQYRIHMEDMSGNWNFFIANITVQDTTPPPTPLFANSPSGDVSGILVFDWVDGTDPSGILYYILIIDNETDPLATPGYVYFVNITNIGTESSYYELPYILPSGRYYYFLYQIDGVGHQSSSTMGTFTVISGYNGNLTDFFIIIIIIIAISVGSIATIIIVKKNAQKKAKSPRKKIPLKHILPHINKISIPKKVEIIEDKMEIEPRKTGETKDLADLDQIELDLMEIKALGEELFNEGAYLEARKQFELAKNMLLDSGRIEDAKLFSDLIEGIRELIDKRENLLKILERAKVEGNVVKLFEIYYDLTLISKKLRDSDALHMFQLEFIQIFQNDNLKLIELEDYRIILEEQIKLFLVENNTEKVIESYEKCEIITELLVQLGKEEEKINLDRYRNKKFEFLGER